MSVQDVEGDFEQVLVLVSIELDRSVGMPI